jgi:hypothetical protein
MTIVIPNPQGSIRDSQAAAQHRITLPVDVSGDPDSKFRFLDYGSRLDFRVRSLDTAEYARYAQRRELLEAVEAPWP